MSIFDEFTDKSELLKAVEESVTETQAADGSTVYRLPNDQAELMRQKFDAEARNAKSQREKKQKAEARVAELTAQYDKTVAELEQLKATNPSDLKETLQKYVDQTAESAAKIRALERELEPLRKENEAYHAKETRERIEAELVEAAKKLDCCDSAMRDVKRLAPMFHISESGVVVSDDNRLVQEKLEEEVRLSPHWLKRSQGGGTGGGTAPLSNAAQFQQALKGGDFAAVLASAPRTPVR